MTRELDWKKLLSSERFAKDENQRIKYLDGLFVSKDYRVPHEKDFDRVIFSTPVRRLQDKTQVFPLDQHDSVRTRLTHSLEVANIARTLAAQLVSELDIEIDDDPFDVKRAIPALVAAIAIAHDVGNPPFGHQGESAIREWVKKTSVQFKSSISSPRDQALLKDYLYFDGNPQGFRLLTRLQGVVDGGLDLTAATLRASFKYPWPASSSRIDPEKPKFGYFQTEKKHFEWCSAMVGIPEGRRHPLASIMEASDDICYSILDVEDGVKKELVSTAHLMLYLKDDGAETAASKWLDALSNQYYEDVKWLKKSGITGPHAEDVLMQLLRSYFISLAVSVAVPQLKEAIQNGVAMEGNPCLAHKECAALLELLKNYTKKFIYSRKYVEKVELEGHRVIPYLLGSFWGALERTETNTGSKLDKYVVKQISQNYFRVYEKTRSEYPAWYARLQVVCDMVCGMTDSFALSMTKEFKSIGVECEQ
jgi:dGTPase